MRGGIYDVAALLSPGSLGWVGGKSGAPPGITKEAFVELLAVTSKRNGVRLVDPAETPRSRAGRLPWHQRGSLLAPHDEVLA